MKGTSSVIAVRCGAALFCAFSLAAPVQAVLISNAAVAGYYLRDCRSAAARATGASAPDKCIDSGYGADFSDTMIATGYDAAYGGYMSGIVTHSPLGVVGGVHSGGSVDASGSFGTLVLKQGALTSTPYARVSAHTFALQSFGWDGTGDATRRLHIALDFTALGLSDSAAFEASTSAASIAQLAVHVFSLATPSFDYTPDPFYAGDPLDFTTQAAVTGTDYRLEGEQDITEVLVAPLASSLTVTMEAGRYYFIDSWIGVWAKFGGSIDAWHTMTVGFADTTGLLPAAPSDEPVHISEGSVPEPGTLLLAGLALAAVVRTRR